MTDDQDSLADFAGTARLFPLPNVVLFPQVMQPLHIFEPRYRQMTGEALASDRFIALVLLRPGWETGYAGRPAIHDIACLGKIVADQKLANGRYNILLRGLSRIRLIHELPQHKLFRQARVELVGHSAVPHPDFALKLRRRLAKRLPDWFAAQGAVLDQFRKLVRSELPLGALCDIIAFALPLEAEAKQHLLAEFDVGKRAERLLEFLSKPDAQVAAEAERKFPPEFSVN